MSYSHFQMNDDLVNYLAHDQAITWTDENRMLVVKLYIAAWQRMGKPEEGLTEFVEELASILATDEDELNGDEFREALQKIFVAASYQDGSLN